MFCTSCGSQFQDISNQFCGRCGARRADLVAAAAPTAFEQKAQVQTQQISASPRKKSVALWIALIGGPFGYAYLLRTHKSKFIVAMVFSLLASMPLVFTMLGSDYYRALYNSYSTDNYDLPEQTPSVWSFYATPGGLVTLGLSIILRVFVIIDLNRLPDSFYEKYKD